MKHHLSQKSAFDVSFVCGGIDHNVRNFLSSFFLAAHDASNFNPIIQNKLSFKKTIKTANEFQ